jgi:hypothetical protein
MLADGTVAARSATKILVSLQGQFARLYNLFCRFEGVSLASMNLRRFRSCAMPDVIRGK